MSVSKTSLLGRYRAGKPIPARFLNAVTARAERAAKEADRKTIAYRPIGRGAKVTRFRYKSMGPDYLICRTWDGTTEGDTDVKVAKPYLLRRSTEQTGYTYVYKTDYERTSTKISDGSEEEQEIVPAYVENDEIWAAKADTGVTVSGQDVTYIDLNLDARAWAAKAEGAIVAIFDGSRTGKVYTGHLLNLTTGAAETTAVQWMFWGDRYGTGDLVTENTPVVLTHKCPAYLEYDEDWSPIGGAKYMAVLSPFAMLA